jgi:hypothetical protein
MDLHLAGDVGNGAVGGRDGEAVLAGGIEGMVSDPDPVEVGAFGTEGVEGERVPGGFAGVEVPEDGLAFRGGGPSLEGGIGSGEREQPVPVRGEGGELDAMVVFQDALERRGELSGGGEAEAVDGLLLGAVLVEAEGFEIPEEGPGGIPGLEEAPTGLEVGLAEALAALFALALDRETLFAFEAFGPAGADGLGEGGM